MTAELVEFLRAREAEREQAALAATPGPWRVRTEGTCEESYVWADKGGRYGDGGPVTFHPDGAPRPEGAISDDDASHVARHDPAWVLADVAAKRQIIDEVVPQVQIMDEMIESEWSDGLRHSGEKLLRLLALAHASHSEYRAEWAP